MRRPTIFGTHLKEDFFVTHSKNVFLNNLVLKRTFFCFPL